MDSDQVSGRVALIALLLAAGCPRAAVDHAFLYIQGRAVPEDVRVMLDEIDEAIAHGRRVAGV